MQLRKIINQFLKLIRNILLFIITGTIGIFVLKISSNTSVEEILKVPEVQAVLVIALPTLIVWVRDLESKKNQDNVENTNLYTQVQNKLEEKYNQLLEEIYNFTLTGSEDTNISTGNSREVEQIINKISNFIYILNSSKQHAAISFKEYSIDLSLIYKEINRLMKDNESEVLDASVREIKSDIIQYAYDKKDARINEGIINSLNNDSEFYDIDFTLLQKPRNLQNRQDQVMREKLTFIQCTIDIDMIGDILSLKGESVYFRNCEFVQSNLVFRTSISNEDLVKKFKEIFESESIEIS